MIDRSFSAYTRVDLGNQRRRHLNEREAALEGSGSQTCHIPNNAAAKRNERRAALNTSLNELIVQECEPGQIFVFFTRWDLDYPWGKPSLLENANHLFPVNLAHNRIGHQRQTRRSESIVVKKRT